MNKRTITIEDLADGRVRVTVDGPQFVANGVNLSTRTIGVHQLADFAPDSQDLKTYASAHCTAGDNWHSSKSGCDGTCHDPGCGIRPISSCIGGPRMDASNANRFASGMLPLPHP